MRDRAQHSRQHAKRARCAVRTWQCHLEFVLPKVEPQLHRQRVHQCTRRREPAPRVEGELPRAAARLLDLLGDQLRRLLLRDALRGTTRAHARCGLTSFSESTGVARAVHGREPGPRRRGRQCVCGCGLCVARAHLLLHAQVELEGALCITDGRAELAQRGVEVGEVRRSDRRRRWRRGGADATPADA